MNVKKKIHEVVVACAGYDVDVTLKSITEQFVGLHEAYISRFGQGDMNPKNEIDISGGYRDITIHKVGYNRDESVKDSTLSLLTNYNRNGSDCSMFR